MLLFMADRDSSWRVAANNTLKDFLNDPEKRSKSNTPDLGRFLINLLLSDRGWDEEVASAYFNEYLIRQVSWFLSSKKERKNQTERNAWDADKGGVDINSEKPWLVQGPSHEGPQVQTQSQGRNRRNTATDASDLHREIDSKHFGSSWKGSNVRGQGDKVVTLAEPTAAQSLISLSAEYDKRRMMSINRGSGSQVGNESVYDDNTPDGCSVISSSNMHEFTNHNHGNNHSQSGYRKQNSSLNIPDSDNAHTYATSYSELAFLENDPISPYRLVTTFEVTSNYTYVS